MKGNKAHFICYVSPRKIDQLMRCADLFEKSRYVAKLEKITASFKDDVELTLERAFQMFSGGALGDDEHEIVYALLLSIVVDGETIQNDRVKPYIKEGLTSITNGEKWFTIRNLLESQGFEVETGGYLGQEAVSVEFVAREEAKC